MSALAAFLRLSDRAPALAREEVERVADAFGPRGAVGDAWWHTRRQVVLAARGQRTTRAAAGSADGGVRPLVSPTTGSALVLDGRLLDRAALAASYEARGLGAPNGASSAQLVLDLLELRGERALHDLRGAFALAYWDERRGALLLARDGFGAKPLYYSDHGGVLRAASTVRALEASGELPLDRDPAAEGGFLLTGAVPEPFTWRRAIRALPAGHFLWIRAGDGVVHEPRAWVRLERELARAVEAADGVDEACDAREPGPIASSCDLAAAASEAVHAHLARDTDASDAGLACLVSGSVASRSLLALVAQDEARGVRGVHLDVHLDGYPDGHAAGALALDGEAARRVQEVARRSGAEVSCAGLGEERFLAEWPRVAERMDQPTLGGLVTYFACKAARELGLARAVVGHGGSLLFDDGWSRGAPASFANGAGVFERHELGAVLGVERARDGLAALDAHAADERAQRPVVDHDAGLARVVDALARLRGGRLRDVDWAAAAHGVEVELPFCDLALWRRVGPIVVRRARRVEPGALLAPSAIVADDARAVLGAWAARAHRRDRGPGSLGSVSHASVSHASVSHGPVNHGPREWTRALARSFVDLEAA